MKLQENIVKPSPKIIIGDFITIYYNPETTNFEFFSNLDKTAKLLTGDDIETFLKSYTYSSIIASLNKCYSKLILKNDKSIK